MAKKYSVRIQADAIDELDHIYQYIFKESPRAAKKILDGLRKRVLSLALFPQRGSRAQLMESRGHRNQVRFVPYLDYLIFYTIRGHEILVLHITGPGHDSLYEAAGLLKGKVKGPVDVTDLDKSIYRNLSEWTSPEDEVAYHDL